MLTGLSGENYDKALWDAGFDLDDWDFGLVSPVPLHEMVQSEDDNGMPTEVMQGKDSPCYMLWIMSGLENFGVQCDYVRYKGWHYYLRHH
jgi:hypothetical protein